MIKQMTINVVGQPLFKTRDTPVVMDLDLARGIVNRRPD